MEQNLKLFLRNLSIKIESNEILDYYFILIIIAFILFPHAGHFKYFQPYVFSVSSLTVPCGLIKSVNIET